MRIIYLYFVFVFGISVPLALFEIWLERHKAGWGNGFRPGSFWGKELGWKTGIVDKSLITPYHITTFLMIVPLLAVVTALAGGGMRHDTVVHLLREIARLLCFIPACMFGIMALEDALWFIFNTMFRMAFPDALWRLLRGDVSWHPRWFEFGFRSNGRTRSFMLPDFYLILPCVITILLQIQAWIA